MDKTAHHFMQISNLGNSRRLSGNGIVSLDANIITTEQLIPCMEQHDTYTSLECSQFVPAYICANWEYIFVKGFDWENLLEHKRIVEEVLRQQCGDYIEQIPSAGDVTLQSGFSAHSLSEDVFNIIKQKMQQPGHDDLKNQIAKRLFKKDVLLSCQNIIELYGEHLREPSSDCNEQCNRDLQYFKNSGKCRNEVGEIEKLIPKEDDKTAQADTVEQAVEKAQEDLELAHTAISQSEIQFGDAIREFIETIEDAFEKLKRSLKLHND